MPRSRAMNASLRLLTCLALVGGFTAPLAAQTDPAAAAQAELTTLLAEWRAAQGAYTDALLAFGDSLEAVAARAAGDVQRLREMRAGITAPDGSAFARRALALAAKHDDYGGCFALAVAQNFSGDGGVAREVAELLSGRYVMDPVVLEFLERPAPLLAALEWDRAVLFLSRIQEAHEDGMTAAWAKYWLARVLVLAHKENDASPRIRQLLADAERLAAGTLLADRIAAPRFQRERLQVGMVAPELVGQDMDGRPLRLADLRGKVVVLWFWSFANVNSRACLPMMVKLDKRWQGKPLVIVGVNADVSKQYYEAKRKALGVDWRSFSEGLNAQMGPIATRWNVRVWPTFYVLDHEGIIQYFSESERPGDALLAPLVDAAAGAR